MTKVVIFAVIKYINKKLSWGSLIIKYKWTKMIEIIKKININLCIFFIFSKIKIESLIHR